MLFLRSTRDLYSRTIYLSLSVGTIYQFVGPSMSSICFLFGLPFAARNRKTRAPAHSVHINARTCLVKPAKKPTTLLTLVAPACSRPNQFQRSAWDSGAPVLRASKSASRPTKNSRCALAREAGAPKGSPVWPTSTLSASMFFIEPATPLNKAQCFKVNYYRNKSHSWPV